MTFEAIRAYLVKARPRIAWLENVTDIQQTSVDMNESDADYTRDSLMEQGFTVVPVVFSAREYGSAVERLRWWALVFDVHPQYAEQVAMNVRRMLAACKLPRSRTSCCSTTSLSTRASPSRPASRRASGARAM